jgi:hypothetical protein
MTPAFLAASVPQTERLAATSDPWWRAYFTEAKYECVRMLRSPAFGAPLILLPIVFYWFFGVLIAAGSTKDLKALTELFSGFAVLGMMGPGLFGFGAVLALEHQQGLLQFKRALPMPPAANILARMCMALLFGAIISTAMTAVGVFRWARSHEAEPVPHLRSAPYRGIAAFLCDWHVSRDAGQRSSRPCDRQPLVSRHGLSGRPLVSAPENHPVDRVVFPGLPSGYLGASLARRRKATLPC